MAVNVIFKLLNKNQLSKYLDNTSPSNSRYDDYSVEKIKDAIEHSSHYKFYCLVNEEEEKLLAIAIIEENKLNINDNYLHLITSLEKGQGKILISILMQKIKNIWLLSNPDNPNLINYYKSIHGLEEIIMSSKYWGEIHLFYIGLDKNRFKKMAYKYFNDEDLKEGANNMKNYQKIDKLANEIASYLCYWGFDIDYLQEEVELPSFLNDLYDELENEDQEEIDRLYSRLVKLVANYMDINIPTSYKDPVAHEYEILVPQIENFINDKVREKAKEIMASSEFKIYADELEEDEKEAMGESMKNTRVLLGKHKLNEDISSSVSSEDIEKTANFLKYQYNLDDYNDSYYAAVEFFSSDDWYELRKAIRYGIEELDEAFEQLSDYNNREAREYRLKTSKLINIWNQFAAIAKEEFRNAESDGDRYTLFKAIDTDGWAISNIPHSIISKIITG